MHPATILDACSRWSRLANARLTLAKSNQLVIYMPDYFCNGELAQEDEDLYLLDQISPELICTCDEDHTCQQCASEEDE